MPLPILLNEGRKRSYHRALQAMSKYDVRPTTYKRHRGFGVFVRGTKIRVAVFDAATSGEFMRELRELLDSTLLRRLNWRGRPEVTKLEKFDEADLEAAIAASQARHAAQQVPA